MSLTATGLKFRYPSGPLLLDGLDLEVASGCSAVVMAPSGVGKSTLLAVLGGLRRPESGTVTIARDGADVNHGVEQTESATMISWVFQAMHLLPQRTALENVAVAAMPRGLRRSQAEQLAAIELERFAVGELARRQVRTLSGGQCQRVALARASVADPRVVFADEPTGNLDPANAAAVARVLVMGFPRAAVVIATHDPDVAAMADVVYRLDGGRLVPVPR